MCVIGFVILIAQGLTNVFLRRAGECSAHAHARERQGWEIAQMEDCANSSPPAQGQLQDVVVSDTSAEDGGKPGRGMYCRHAEYNILVAKIASDTGCISSLEGGSNPPLQYIVFCLRTP